MCNSDDHDHITVPPHYEALQDEKRVPLPPIPPRVSVQSQPGTSFTNPRKEEETDQRIRGLLLNWEEEKPMVEKTRSLLLQNAKLLLSDKGLPALNNIFRNVSFQGQGHEAEDLHVLLQTFQDWAGELFPQHNFEDLVTHLEEMGNLQVLQTWLRDTHLDLESACLQPRSAECQDSDAYEFHSGISDVVSNWILFFMNLLSGGILPYYKHSKQWIHETEEESNASLN